LTVRPKLGPKVSVPEVESGGAETGSGFHFQGGKCYRAGQSDCRARPEASIISEEVKARIDMNTAAAVNATTNFMLALQLAR
jgi:hypothetical protein